MTTLRRAPLSRSMVRSSIGVISEVCPCVLDADALRIAVRGENEEKEVALRVHLRPEFGEGGAQIVLGRFAAALGVGAHNHLVDRAELMRDDARRALGLAGEDALIAP